MEEKINRRSFSVQELLEDLLIPQVVYGDYLNIYDKQVWEDYGVCSLFWQQAHSHSIERARRALPFGHTVNLKMTITLLRLVKEFPDELDKLIELKEQMNE